MAVEKKEEKKSPFDEVYTAFDDPAVINYIDKLASRANVSTNTFQPVKKNP